MKGSDHLRNGATKSVELFYTPHWIITDQAGCCVLLDVVTFRKKQIIELHQVAAFL